MSITVNEEQTLSLLDGTTFNVKPLKISLLREFMKKFDGIAEVSADNDKSMDLLVACVQIAMRQYKPEVAEDVKELEDLLDLPTVYKVIEAASGIKLGDNGLPNLV
jgi:hypothetical protein